MKYLKYLAAILGILILFFIGRGFVTPSISYESEITVDKPIKEAWAVMNDESKLKQWLTGITNIEHVSGEKGTVGAKTKYTFDENGTETTVVETIRSVTPDESIAMHFNMEGAMNMNYKVNFSEKDGKTHIKSYTTTTGEGMFMRSMVSFMRGSFQTQEDTNMGNLQKLINENTTAYFSDPPAKEAAEEVADVTQE